MLRHSLILAAMFLLVPSAGADTTAPPAEAAAADAQAAAEPESQQFARARLMDMAAYLAGRQQFSVTLNAGYDVLQDNDQMIEFGEIREITVQRPDRLRIETVASDGASDLLLFDGEQITTFDGDSGLYAQVPQPGDIDTTVVHFVRDLRMRLPLAPMLMSRFAEELHRRVQQIEYVEMTAILGKPAHHIAARTASVDFQVWISASEDPLPLRIVMTYRQAEGQPQFRADFSGWDMTPHTDPAQFGFQPPPGAQQIAFAAHLPLPVSTPVQHNEAPVPGDKP